MALKLDNNLLEELGLGALPPEEKQKMLAHIYETLEMRVGVRLAEQMSDQQLDEFEGFINVNDEAGALRWLETTFPAYKEDAALEGGPTSERPNGPRLGSVNTDRLGGANA
jgi:hypothetical protein